VAAYELDKLLGLGMVPPTVLREVNGRAGSLQLWVDGCREWSEQDGREAPTDERSRELSRMKMFDALLGTGEREGRDILIDGAGNLILIDHSRAFAPVGTLPPDPPARADRLMVEKLRGLDRKRVEAVFKRLLDAEEIRSLLARRDLLIAHLDRLIAEKGEAAVLF
jgi:hypothetical protein